MPRELFELSEDEFYEIMDTINAYRDAGLDREDVKKARNDVWIEIGKRRGFDGMTKKPEPSKDFRIMFSAEVIEDAV